MGGGRGIGSLFFFFNFFFLGISDEKNVGDVLKKFEPEGGIPASSFSNDDMKLLFLLFLFYLFYLFFIHLF